MFLALELAVLGVQLAPPAIHPGLAQLREAKPYTLRWRVGAGVSHSNPLHFAWPVNRPGWFHDWDIDIFTLAGGYNEPLPRLALAGDERALGMTFVPLISTPAGKLLYTPELLTRLAAKYPGRAWIVGNEPDIATQDWATPAQYAATYHAVYEAIKQADASAMIVAGNISQVTTLRLRYLDAVLAAYRNRYGTPMPLDAWGVHVYILPEQSGGWGAGLPPGINDNGGDGVHWTVDQHDDLRIVATQLRAMRSWMANNGFANRPLWITEYGILMPREYGYTPQRVAQYLSGSFDLFSNLCDEHFGLPTDGGRLVQRWNWFSTRAAQFPAGDLFDSAGRPTLVMHTLSQYLATHGADQANSACN